MAAEEAKEPEYSNLPYAVLFAKRLVEVIKKVTDPDEIQVTWKITKPDSPQKVEICLVSAPNPDISLSVHWEGTFGEEGQPLPLTMQQYIRTAKLKVLMPRKFLDAMSPNWPKFAEEKHWRTICAHIIAAELRTRRVG
jgi:hypothetical protein